MLRRTLITRSGGHGGIDPFLVFPNGLRRTAPWKETPHSSPTMPRMPGGFYVARHSLGLPNIVWFEFAYWRSALLLWMLCVFYDLNFGFPVPYHREIMPGIPTHSWFGHNGGIPHHFWEFQDGFYVPNESGTKRWVP